MEVVGSDAEGKLIAILKILSESSEPLGSITIARRLEQEGIFLSERAVRYHLRIADERGYTQPGGRDGRMITQEGQQEVKEALYYFNEEQIAREIQNYIFAVNFEIGSTEKCPYTGDKIDITEEFFKGFEQRILGDQSKDAERKTLRNDTQKEYATQTLPQQVSGSEKSLLLTTLFKNLNERYIYNIKEKVLDPFSENENFRRAIKDYDKEDFKTYDRKIQDDVTYLMANLTEKLQYKPQGAKAVCIYVIDNDLARKFTVP